MTHSTKIKTIDLRVRRKSQWAKKDRKPVDPNKVVAGHKKSKQYWKTYERDLVTKFRRWFKNARRALQFQRKNFTPDILYTPFYIEVKYGAHGLTYTTPALSPETKKKQFLINPLNPAHVDKIIAYYGDREREWQELEGYIDTREVILVYRIRLTHDRVIMSKTLAMKLEINLAEAVVETPLNVVIEWKDFERALDRKFNILQEAA